MRTKYSIKNTITAFISNIITFIFLFIGQTIFIKILGVEYVGLNGLFSNVLSVLGLFELGIGSTITYNLYKSTAKNNKEKTKSLMQFYKKGYNYIALTIFTVGILIIPFLKYIIKDTSVDINIYIVYVLFLISTVASYILAYKRSIIHANQRNYIINIVHIIYIIILNILQLLIIYITKNYYLYIIVKIVCIILENIVLTIKANKDYPYLLEKNVKKLDKKTKDDIKKRVKALFIHKTSGVITNGSDNIIISSFLGLKAVGLYTSYNYIISTIKTFISSITSSTTASIGNLLVEKNYENRYVVFKKINFLNFWLTIVTSSCLLFLMQPFITMWLGKEYLLSKYVLLVLVINYFQTMMRSTFSVFKDAAGIWVEDRFVPIIQSTINIVSSIILLKIFGLVGVFMGTILSSFAVWFYSYPKFVYNKLFNKNYFDYYKQLIIHLIIFISVIVITYLVLSMITINSIIIKLLLNGIISLIISNLLLYLIYHKTNEFKYFCILFKLKK